MNIRFLKSFFLLLFGSFFFAVLPVVNAQNSDLEKKVHEVIDRYQKASALELNFEFQLTFPEQKTETFKGKFYKIGENYLVDLKDYTLISDGKIQYTIQEHNKEVQITELDDESMELSSPSGILKYLSQNEFKYFDKSELKQGGKALRIIEMVPEDRESDYFKIRFSFEEGDTLLRYIEIFARDGTRVQLTVEKTLFSGKFSPESIIWDPEKYKDYYIEDLRID